jgi:hypothetical protein
LGGGSAGGVACGGGRGGGCCTRCSALLQTSCGPGLKLPAWPLTPLCGGMTYARHGEVLEGHWLGWRQYAFAGQLWWRATWRRRTRCSALLQTPCGPGLKLPAWPLTPLCGGMTFALQQTAQLLITCALPPPLGPWAEAWAGRMGSELAIGISSRSHPAHALQACQWCPGAPEGLAQSCRLVTTAAYLCTPLLTTVCRPAGMSHCEALAKQATSHVKAFLHSQGCWTARGRCALAQMSLQPWAACRPCTWRSVPAPSKEVHRSA